MRLLATLIGITLFIAGCEPKQDFTGIVTEITDGDTLTVVTLDDREIVVRLAEIDTPERGQPFSRVASRALSELAFQKAVTVSYFDTDAYGRTVGRVFAGDIDVSAELVRRGVAWVYRDYARDQSLFALEEQARKAGQGLWGSPEPAVPPWEWRRGARPAQSAPAQLPITRPGGPFSCGSKQYCREMVSCEEARFYLSQCGATTIDGDNDGTPCEAICR
jgi:endonuclease YncB( thermonuclease family)